MYPNDDVAYAHGRLHGTIVRYNGKGVLINEVRFVDRNHPLRLAGSYLLSGDHVGDDIDNFDLVPVTLGWVNYENNKVSHYYTRMPIRQDWRQGLRPFNSRYFDVFGQMRKPQAFDYRNIGKTIDGIYPSIEGIIKKLHGFGNDRSLAWCRDFAITGSMDVLYKMYGKVGNFKDGLILLDEKFTWVDESLKEVY